MELILYNLLKDKTYIWRNYLYSLLVWRKNEQLDMRLSFPTTSPIKILRSEIAWSDVLDTSQSDHIYEPRDACLVIVHNK